MIMPRTKMQQLRRSQESEEGVAILACLLHSLSVILVVFSGCFPFLQSNCNLSGLNLFTCLDMHASHDIESSNFKHVIHE